MTPTLEREASSAPTTPASGPDSSAEPMRRGTWLRAITDAYTQRRLRRHVERQVQGSYAWRPTPH